MSEPGASSSRPPAQRFAVKMHRQVSLVRTADPLLTEELLARKPLGRFIVGRLSETVLLVQTAAEEAILAELHRMGHTPRVVR